MKKFITLYFLLVYSSTIFSMESKDTLTPKCSSILAKSANLSANVVVNKNSLGQQFLQAQQQNGEKLTTQEKELEHLGDLIEAFWAKQDANK